MNRDALEHLIRAAGEVTNEYEFVVVGSQAILGPIPNPPPELTMSMEADMYPMNAEEKADELIAALEDAGARAPDRDQIVRVLGEDGGATCEDPNDALNRAILLSQLSNGASGPGARPVVTDSRVFQGQKLIIEIYCPDELDDFNEFVDDLETDDVAG